MKFNKGNVQKTISKNRLYSNFEGGESFTVSDPKLELYKMTCANLFGESKFYEQNQKKSDSSSNRIVQLAREIAETDPEFILKLAYYARTQMNLRTVPTVLLFESSIDDNIKPFVRRWAPRIINRVDEMAEIVAMFTQGCGHIGNLSAEGSFPAAIKKGIRDTLQSGKFSKYQLAKYTNENATGKVKLKDVIKITRPRPKDSHMQETFNAILNGDLKQINTWNAITSKEGSTDESWEKSVDKMPIMALVKNLRNILDRNPNEETIFKLVVKLTNPTIIKNSRLFPFRFLTAYKMIEDNENEYTQQILNSLETTMDISVENIPTMLGKTAFLVDVSGSMLGNPISKDSVVTTDQIAGLLCAMAHQVCETSHIVRYSDWAEIIRLSKRHGVLANSRAINKGQICGGGTSTYLGIRALIEKKYKVDRIINLTDAIGYGGSLVDMLIQYRKEINPKCRYYEIDLNGYGNTQIPDRDPLSCLISGWTEKVFEFININESTGRGPVEEIEKITLPK